MGWVRTRRDAKDFSFLEINDGSCLANLQVVVDAGIEGCRLPQGRVGRGVRGCHRRPGRLAGQGDSASKCAPAGWNFWARPIRQPIPSRKNGIPTNICAPSAHLRPRTNKYGAMTRLRSDPGPGHARLFRGPWLRLVHTPILTASDCEGRGRDVPGHVVVPGRGDLAGRGAGQTRLFRPRGLSDRFGPAVRRDAGLRPGPGLHLRADLRAEHSDTSRHAARFWMVGAGDGLRPIWKTT